MGLIKQLANENNYLLCSIKSAIESLANQKSSYYREPFLLAGGSPAGAHVRHILDFYQCFFEGVGGGIIDYDKRARNPLIETDIAEAGKTIEHVCAQLAGLNAVVESNLTIASSLNPESKSVQSLSTIERELQFLHSHTVHHMAILAIIIRNFGIELDNNFGKAPSTIRYEREHVEALKCAP